MAGTRPGFVPHQRDHSIKVGPISTVQNPPWGYRSCEQRDFHLALSALYIPQKHQMLEMVIDSDLQQLLAPKC